MKSRFITAIILFAVSIGAAIFSSIYATKCTRELGKALENAMACAVAESSDWEDATRQVERLWEKHKGFLHILLPHVNLNELEWSIGALPEYLAQEDNMLYVEQCVRGLQCVNTVQEMERPRWGSIF